MPTITGTGLCGTTAKQTPPRGYRGRVRTGCLTCRTRKVRCDESRPVCDNCVRLRRACSYPAKKIQRVPPVDTGIHENSFSNVSGEESSTFYPTETSTPSQSLLVSPSVDEIQPTRRLLHGDASGITTQSAQDSFLFPDSAIVSLHQRDTEIASHDGKHAAMSTATLISRDINLTTTMDKLTATSIGLPPSLIFFMEYVNCTPIMPFDPINWWYLKHHLVAIAESNSVIASALIALTTLCKAQYYSLHLTTAQSLHQNAKDDFEKSLEASPKLETVMLTIFLLCLFEYQHSETIPMLQAPSPLFTSLSTLCKERQSACSAIISKIAAWLQLLHISASRAGGSGILSDNIFELLSEFVDGSLDIAPHPSQQVDTSITIYQVLSKPVFEFYYRLQMISGQIARLTHYHRSRSTGADQEQVIQGLAEIRSRLETLWENRSATQRQSPQDLRSHFSPKIADLMLTLVGLCTAAYHAEFVEMHRVMGDPVSDSMESRCSRRAIREIVEGDWNSYDGTRLNPGFLRPLFLYAIECMDREQNEWAVNKLKEIDNRLFRNEFFADFAKALSDTQFLKDRRVASKYFCIWWFGEPPPHL